MKNTRNFFRNFYYQRSSFFDGFVYGTNQKSSRRNIISVIIAIIIALLLSFIVITATGTKAAAFFSMFTEVFSDDLYAQNFCVNMCTFAVAALAFSFCLRVGVFNIGISGQMLAGGSMAIFIDLSIGHAMTGGWILTLIFSIIGATFVALVTGLLKIYCRVNEVVTGILLNWIILYIVGAIALTQNSSGEYVFISQTSLNSGGFYTKEIDSTFAFTKPGEYCGWAFSLGATIVCVLVVWILLKYTVFGHKLKSVGLSPDAAKNFGYNKKVLQLSSFLISGVLAGVLGVIVYTASETPQLTFQDVGKTALSSTQAQGFNGIAIGLIALNNPIAILFVSFIFSFPYAGQAVAGLPDNTVQLIVGIIMYIIAIYTILSYFKPWRWIMRWRFGKSNAQNYMTLENLIFELSENFRFQSKKIYVQNRQDYLKSKVKTKNIFLKSIYSIFYSSMYFFIKYYDKKVINQKRQLRTKYTNDRIEITKKFKNDCIVNVLNFYDNYNFAKKKISLFRLSTGKGAISFTIPKFDNWQWNNLRKKIKQWSIDAGWSEEQIKQVNLQISTINTKCGVTKKGE